MSNLEKTKLFLNEMGIPFRETRDESDTQTFVHIGDDYYMDLSKSPLWNGYHGFFLELAFDERGALISYGAFEQ